MASDVTFQAPTTMLHLADAIKLIDEYLRTTDLGLRCPVDDCCKFMLSRMQETHTISRLAYDGPTAIGFIIIGYRPVYRELRLEDLFIKPHWRNKGIAKQMIFSLEDQLASTDAEIFAFKSISLSQQIWARLAKGIKIRTRKVGYFTRADYDKWKEV